MRKLSLTAGMAVLCLLSAQANAADVDAGKAKFQQLCATCHGPAGGGDGPASAALNPKPRALSDAEWQASVDDAYLGKVIKEGGPAVGLSPMMVAQRGLSDADLANIIAYIRSLSK